MYRQALPALCCFLLLSAAAGAAPAPSPTKALSAADVWAIAKASASGRAATSRVAAGSSGRRQADAAKVPVDEEYLAQNPGAAENVPLAAPDEDAANAAKFDFDFSGKKPADSILRPSANRRVAATPFAPIGTDAGSFVTVSGSQFSKGGQVFYPSGTSWFNMFELGKYTEADIDDMLAVHWANGVRVIRVFAHNDGFGTSMPVTNPIQPTVGVFREDALQRYDYAVDAAARVGIHLIVTMTNYWPEYGGIQWYVDQVTNTPGLDKELFFTDERARLAYKTWIRTITQRVNTVNGRKYCHDPTIFAWELCNECHTGDNYEIDRSIVPGTLLYNWVVEMADYFKNTLQVRSMVAEGSEGYRARGQYDLNAPITYPYLNWANTGLKGADFNRNLYIPNIDFATIHAYPSNFGLSNTEYQFINEYFIGDRAALVKAAGKPLMLEEYGAPRSYVEPRDTLFTSILAAAAQYDFQSTLVWEVWARFGDDYNYDFAYTQAGGPTVLKEFAWQLNRAAGATSPHIPPPPPTITCTCSDNPPSTDFTCAEQKGFGKCCEPWMLAGNGANPCGFCLQTCADVSCGADDAPVCSPVTLAPAAAPTALPNGGCSCSDTPPSADFSCAEQKGFGKCCESWMVAGNGANPCGYCLRTCADVQCRAEAAAVCSPATSAPTAAPTAAPTSAPSRAPTRKPTAKPTAKPTPKPTSKQTPKPTSAALPASCAVRSQYRAAGGCRSCLAKTSPYATTIGGVGCYTPTTVSSKSTACTAVTLSAYIRNPNNSGQTVDCVDAKRSRTSILLPVFGQSAVPWLKASSYILSSLRLDGGLPARKDAKGIYAVQRTVAGVKRLMVEFQDARVLSPKKGQTVRLRGVLDAGGSALDWCWQANIKVCR